MSSFAEYTRKKKKELAENGSFSDFTRLALGDDIAPFRTDPIRSGYIHTQGYRDAMKKIKDEEEKEEKAVFGGGGKSRGGEDIAPTTERTWFDKGAFKEEEGNFITKLLKSNIATNVDVRENLATGILGMGEKAVDALAYLAPAMAVSQQAQYNPTYQFDINEYREMQKVSADFMKKDLYDEEKIAKTIITNPAKKVGIDAEKQSFLGEKSDALVQSAGQLGATVGLQAVGVPWWLTTGATSFGSEAENALEQGATYEEAGASALITAGADILTEKLSGGIKFGGKALDDVTIKPLTEKIANKTIKTLTNVGIDAIGEGSEEVVASVISNLGTALYKEESIEELLTSEEALDEYIESFIGGAVLGGGMGAINAVKSETTSDNNTLTENEQKVVDKVLETRIEEAEVDGKKLTKTDKAKLEEEVKTELQKGYIDTDTIEGVLGGETYNTYNSIVEQENSLREEIERLQSDPRPTAQSRLVEAKAELEAIEKGTEKTELKDRLSLEVQELTKSDLLSESYNEKARRSQVFEADLTKYDAKAQETVKKAVESGILNNTNKTHDFVDMIAKLSAEKGVLFDFTNNENLKKSGFALEGVTVNGLVSGSDVILNIDSNKALNTVVGHEITHILEGSDLYKELQTAVKEYATTKGEYDSRLQAITKLYEGVKNVNIDNELTSELVGDYLFTDADFINNLSTTKPNVFKKIYEEIKYLYKLATAGSKEARQLEKVKRTFDKVYKESTAKATTEAEVKLSLSEDTEGHTLTNEQKEYFKDSKVVDENGQLKVMYHGTANDFTVFNPMLQGGKNGTAEGYGIYFADTNEVSDAYGGKLLKGYLNVTHPASSYEKTIKRNELVKLIKATSEAEAKKFVDDGDYDNISDALKDTWISNYVYTYDMPISKAYNDVAESIIGMSENDMDIVQEVMSGMAIRNYESAYEFYDILKSTMGIDGFVTEWENDNISSGKAQIVVAFDSNQFKNLDNTNPTKDADIRRSLGDQTAPTGKYNVYGKDIGLQAPTQPKTPVQEVVDDYAPLTEAEANERDAMQSDRLYSLNEADMPEEVEAPIYEEQAEAESPFDEKDIQEVGNRKQKAYMYENPEVKPYFQEEARIMLGELRNSVKGEKHFNDQLYYDTNGEQGWFGTRRETSEQIAYMLDRFKYTYADIEKGLNAIIEDHGAENNAISKRLEFMLDERLREGYTDFLSGMDIPSNQDYINLLNEKQINEYSDEAYNRYLESLAYAEAPADHIRDTTKKVDHFVDTNKMVEDIAPVAKDIEVSEGVQRQIDLETGEIVDEDAKLDKAKQRINRKLAEEKKEAYEEFRHKMDLLQKELGSRDKYVSERALNLYEELTKLKKGVKASDELGYLLDFGFKWKELKTALLHTKAFPASEFNENSAVEALVRESIGREYDNRLHEIDALESEYQNKVKQLNTDAENEIAELESGNRRKTHGEIQRAYVDNIKQKFSEAGMDFDKILEKAIDKSTFASVDNTPQRYIEKTLGYKEGQILNDLTINQEALNESKAIKWLNSFTDRKSGELARLSKKYGIKPNSKEDASAQMYAEGFYINDNNEFIRYGDAELAKDFPNVETQKRIKALVNNPRIREIYDNTLEQINESRVRNGYPEIPRRDNYYLHFRAMDDTFSRLGIPFNPNDIRAKDLPTDINGMTADLKPGQPYFASANQRKGLRTSHSLLGGMERYLTSAKNQIYHIDDIQTLRGLRNYVADMYGQAHGLENLDTLTEEEAEARVKEVYDAHLSTFAKFLNEQANVLAGKTSLIDRGLEGVIGRRGIQTLNTINSQVAKNMVGFNVSSALTGFTSTVQGFAKANKYDAVKAFTQVASNRMKSIFGKSDGFAENDPTMIRRRGAEKFYRTPYEKVSDLGYTLMSGVDNLSTEFIIRAKYNELTRKGMDSDKAQMEAGKWAMRVLGDRSLGQQPQLYNSKMLGLVTKFQLEVRNQLDSMVYDTIQEAKSSNEDINNRLVKNTKTAVKVASTMAQLAVFQHLFGKAFESVAGYNPTFDIISTLMTLFGFDDDEEKEDTVLDNAEQALLELLEDLPYTSTFTGGRIPIQSALPIEQLIKGEDNYGNEKSRWETLSETAPYYIMPGGYNQIKKSVQGMGMFSDEHPVSGSYTDSGNLRFPVEDTPLNRVQAGIFGQWANENARDYFDNERNPLKEKQIEEFAELDIPIKDYWKYREGLNEQETLEDKFDYIASLDLPVEKKNIMINNVVDRKEDVDLTNYDEFSDYEEFDFATKNAEKYEYLQSINVSYDEYNQSEESREAYNWAYKNPEKYYVSKAVASDVVTYREYTKALNDIEADKDENGKTISGSRKAKVANYVNGLEADYGEKIILFKSEYPADDTYNEDIIDYLNNREDISYSDMEVILKELGFTVDTDGNIYW